MKYLVGDIGNTLIKISILNKNFKIYKTFNFNTKKLTQKKTKNLFLMSILNNNLNKKILFHFKC